MVVLVARKVVRGEIWKDLAAEGGLCDERGLEGYAKSLLQ
jgi:hypothetical protein